jgi:hypothetical protein
MKTVTEPEAENIVALLLDLAPYTKVLEHQPGRISLQLAFSGLVTVQENDISGLLEAIPGILDTRTKWWSRSVEIDYDVEQLPYDLWEALLSVKDNPDGAGQVRDRLRTVLDRHLP